MATFKHISSKNADYGAAEQYLTFEHDEFTMKPTLDENGRLVPREDYRLATLNCGDEDFAIACMRSNLRYANLNPYFGSEQGGTRPVLVLQNNVGNFFCPTLIVAPLTSKWIKKKELPTHYALESVPELGLKSVVLLEQIKTIDKRRVLSYIGRVSREEMRAIDDALQVSLDIHIPEEMEAP